jgi:hypothetical protein
METLFSLLSVAKKLVHVCVCAPVVSQHRPSRQEGKNMQADFGVCGALWCVLCGCVV